MKIKICKSCEGSGKIEIDIGTHNSEYKLSNCKKCNGTGKVLKGSYSYIIPYGTKEKLFYKIDSEIMELIRKLEKESII